MALNKQYYTARLGVVFLLALFMTLPFFSLTHVLPYTCRNKDNLESASTTFNNKFWRPDSAHSLGFDVDPKLFNIIHSTKTKTIDAAGVLSATRAALPTYSC